MNHTLESVPMSTQVTDQEPRAEDETKVDHHRTRHTNCKWKEGSGLCVPCSGLIVAGWNRAEMLRLDFCSYSKCSDRRGSGAPVCNQQTLSDGFSDDDSQSGSHSSLLSVIMKFTRHCYEWAASKICSFFCLHSRWIYSLLLPLLASSCSFLFSVFSFRPKSLLLSVSARRCCQWFWFFFLFLFRNSFPVGIFADKSIFLIIHRLPLSSFWGTDQYLSSAACAKPTNVPCKQNYLNLFSFSFSISVKG